MTSEERRKARRERRENERAEKRKNEIAKYDDYSKVIDANHLVRAAFGAAKGVSWKASVKKYKATFLREIWSAREKLKKGKSVVQGFIEFKIAERGKTRQIKAVHFAERVVQKALCDEALVPALRYGLVYDNGASLTGKGIHFALNRVKHHLRMYYKRHGTNEGWILLIDFHGYFDNILHEPIAETIRETFQDKHLRWLVWQFVKSFGDKSLGLGSQVSQILAVNYANPLDHFIREVLRIGLSARYNDDVYCMHESKEYLEACVELIRPVLQSLGIELNEKKTKIIPLKQFKFLKMRFFLTKNGKVIMKGNKQSFKRMRNRIRYFKEELVAGRMTFKQVLSGYQSWYGYQNHTDSHVALRRMDKMFYEYFGIWVPHGRKAKSSKKLKRRVRFMWAYVDEQKRVLGLNRSNMDGNTGWIEAATTLGVDDQLATQKGACLYKVQDGVIVARSKEEIAADEAEIEPQEQTDRIDVIEGRVDNLEQNVSDIVNGVTVE